MARMREVDQFGNTGEDVDDLFARMHESGGLYVPDKKRLQDDYRSEEPPREMLPAPPVSGTDFVANVRSTLRPSSGGVATPVRPRTPTPAAGKGPAVYGGANPHSQLFGKAGGLLEGGLGVPGAIGGDDDLSALILQLLEGQGGGY